MSEAKPFVSIVVTCFNYARYVGAAIRSALGQSYPCKEVVVVNDGSTDGSLDVIRSFGPSVRVVDQPNRGWVASYNAGFAASRGDVIIFLDADDLLGDGTLERVTAVWSPRWAKVQYDLAVVDAEGIDLGRRFCGFRRGYDARRVRDEFRRTGTYQWPVTAGNAYARWFVERVFPLERHGPDGLLNTLAPLYGEVHTIPEPLAAYRAHGGNGWSTTGFDHRRLPERIVHRQREVAALYEHAARRGVTIAPGNVLDREISFVNYRLLSWRLGLEYPSKGADSPTRLLVHGLRLSWRGQWGLRRAVAHAGWFVAVFLSPRPVARRLFRLRFERRPRPMRQRSPLRWRAVVATEGAS